MIKKRKPAKSGKGARKKTAKKAKPKAPAQRPDEDEVTLSVVDGPMKSVMRSAFLNRPG